MFRKEILPRIAVFGALIAMDLAIKRGQKQRARLNKRLRAIGEPASTITWLTEEDLIAAANFKNGRHLRPVS